MRTNQAVCAAWLSTLSMGCAATIEGDELAVEAAGTSQALLPTVNTENCQDWEVLAIQEAHDKAVVLLERPKTDALFAQWFGGVWPGDSRYQGVRNFVDNTQMYIWESLHLLGAAARETEAVFVTYRCGACQFNSENAAEAVPSQHRVNICGSFTNLWVDGVDTRAGTLIHEIAHLNGQYDMWKKMDDGGLTHPEFARWLGVNDPTGAILNADNYQYFNENPDRR